MVLATIVRVIGSAPQVAGASALFTKRGLVQGTLGGGALEAWAERRSLTALKKKESGLVQLDLGGDLDSADEAVCGGTVSVLLDAAPEKHQAVFRRMEAALAGGKRGVLAVFFHRGAGSDLIISRRWIAEEKIDSATRRSELRLFAPEIKGVLDRPRALAVKQGVCLYAELCEPRPRLIIAGAGHIGQALCRVAARLDFEVAVVDDRPEYASARRLPDADRIVVGSIAPALSRLSRGRRPFIVIVTRGHSRDAEALRACIRKPAAYIGMIGSRRKIALMRQYFLKNRWATGEEFDRVAAPIGLTIHAQTVEEIAISIAAELVLSRRTSNGGPARREPWFGP